jgi:hypothetical protein
MQAEIRQIDGQILRFLSDGTAELKVYDFFFPLDELELEQKEKLSARCRQAITEHWLSFVNSRRVSSRRSLSFDSYQSELRLLNQFRAPRPGPFEFRTIAGETLRFHHPSGEVALKVGNSYLPVGEVDPSRLSEINRCVFFSIENYLRNWRPGWNPT